jgi:glycosyltransferase involved in cell wall biosynthesis
LFRSLKDFESLLKNDVANMNLGFASPVSLQLLRHLVEDGENLPPGYQFAPSADWVQELMKRGHHVSLYTTAREIDAPKTFRGDGITIRIAMQRSNGAGRDFFAAERKQLKQMMTSDRCQMIHAHWTYQFALAALASDIPTLITVHDLPWKVLGHFRDFHRASRLLMAYQVATLGKHFTAVSSDAASHFHRYFNPLAKITVIPNGLPDRILKLRSQPLSSDRSEMVFATILQGWSRRKNAMAALRAFQIVRGEIPNIRLQMIGTDYEQHGKAHQWAIQENLDAGVSFVGLLPYRELLERVNKEVDVIVHPSLDEAFSMTALEVMAMGKVFVAGKNTPGMREMLDFGKSGVLVDVRKPAEIAKAMLQLIRDRGYRNHIGENAFHRASSQYRLDGVMSRYEDLYSTVIRTSAVNIGALGSSL